MKKPAEQAHAANAGLDIAVRMLEPMKEEIPTISYADLYQVRRQFWLDLVGSPDSVDWVWFLMIHFSCV